MPMSLARVVAGARPSIRKAGFALLALLTFACSEPSAPPAANLSDRALIEQYLRGPISDEGALARVKDLLATERGLELMQEAATAVANLQSPTGLGRTKQRASIVDPAYTVSSIPFSYDPTPGGTHWGLDYDDYQTGLIPIGFNFTFFGNTYSDINISTNGFIGFDANMINGCCSGQPLPQDENAWYGGYASLNNLIAGVWTDLDPRGAGTITYGVFGTAPNRRFVVHYSNVNYYYYYYSDVVDFQIKLYETTNVIEIHTKYVGYDGHIRTQGIENATGTDAYFVAGRVTSQFQVFNDGVRFAPAPTDDTPPTITAAVSGTMGDNGWYTSDVDVDWTVTDGESAISSTTGCDDFSITADQAAVTYTCTATSDGGTASESVTIQRDATDPDIAYSGNASSYTVDQSVAISCAASDAMSGLASNDCADVNGDAYTFGLGSHTYSATATDNAGNSASASTTFAVSVTTESLCNLVRRWVDQEGVENSLCQKLANAGTKTGTARANILNAFANEVRAQSGKHVPADKAAILLALAAAL